VKHMVEEHGAETVDDLKMLRVGFGEEPKFDEAGTQVGFPVQMFLFQYAERETFGLEQALKNAKCLVFMEEPSLKGSIIAGGDDFAPLDFTRHTPVSIAYNCAVCGAIAYSPADCLSIDTGTTFTCEDCGGKTVVSLMTVDEYVSPRKKNLQGSCLKCPWYYRKSEMHRHFCAHEDAFKFESEGDLKEKRQIGWLAKRPSWCPLTPKGATK